MQNTQVYDVIVVTVSFPFCYTVYIDKQLNRVYMFSISLRYASSLRDSTYQRV